MTPMLDTHAPPPVLSVAATCAVAAIALAVAMGIGRFAFTPLLPLMVRDGSMPQDAGAWLAVSNYAGYLVGALTASRLHFSSPMLMRVSLIGIAASTAAMGAFDGVAAWIALRGIAGALSAWTLVATSAWTLQSLARTGRTRLSGTVYSGVGLGIAFAGLFCLAAARPGVSASEIWLELGAAAALLIAAPSYFAGRPLAAAQNPEPAPRAQRRPGPSAGLLVCYGAFGFGYILPATFLPALAREVVDDPQVFGLAWPVFGIAAALSTIAIAWLFPRTDRLRVWAVSHAVMAIGVVLPSLLLGPTSIALAALLVGATFMIVTMVGLQEVRARVPGDPTAYLGRLTAAFAIGQLAGPLASGTLDLLPIDRRSALGFALQLAASALALSAAYLWSQARRDAVSDEATESPRSVVQGL